MTTIYIDNGNTVKIYPTTAKVAKAIETLLELDYIVWRETHKGYGVAVIDKETKNEWKDINL